MSESKNDDKEKDKNPWPTLPDSVQHRVSMKWVTLEALRVLLGRVRSQGHSATVLLLTAVGPIEGEFADILDTYDKGIRGDTLSDINVTSSTVHLRTDLLNMYETRDEKIEPTDVGSVIHLRNVSIRLGARRVRMNELAVFATDVIGFTLLSQPLV